MRKLVFAALAGVFMLSSGFTIPKIEKVDVNFGCNCSCLETISVQIGNNPPRYMDLTLRSYTNGSQACSNLTGGEGSYDTSDCVNSSGMLNARSVEELHAAESGC
ncbi:hypothetical protein [Nonlabens sp.]|uniref:hypothetical protein n=1 Tax=Nonlabens sp. TaxID=1888209 RepID=UPI003F6964A1